MLTANDRPAAKSLVISRSLLVWTAPQQKITSRGPGYAVCAKLTQSGREAVFKLSLLAVVLFALAVFYELRLPRPRLLC